MDTIYTPSNEELEKLPKWAVVAFAARCARRARIGAAQAAWAEFEADRELIGDNPGNCIPAKEPFTAADLEALDDALQVAEIAAEAGRALPEFARKSAKRAFCMRRLGGRFTWAAHCVSDAATCAAHAAEGDLAKARMYAVSSAAMAGTALTGRPDCTDEDPNRVALIVAIWHDFERLLDTARRGGWDDNSPIPPHILGPPTPPAPDTLAQLCVFCGFRPACKNREHVIPQWLARLTGDPKRLCRVIGPTRPVKIPLDKFRFPACQPCNDEYGERLENAVAQFTKNLLAEGTITHDHAEALLDWFDKVRVGLWLAVLKLSRNPRGIRPKYHIGTRIGTTDRLLYIGHAREGTQRLAVLGPGDPIFPHIPSVVALVVNHLLFVNISWVGVAAGPLGLPMLVLEPGQRVPGMDDVRLTFPSEGGAARWPAPVGGFSILAQAVWSRDCLSRGDWAPFRERILDVRPRSRVHFVTKGATHHLGPNPTRILPAAQISENALARTSVEMYVLLRRFVTRQLLHDDDPQKEAQWVLLRQMGENGLPGFRPT